MLRAHLDLELLAHLLHEGTDGVGSAPGAPGGQPGPHRD